MAGLDQETLDHITGHIKHEVREATLPLIKELEWTRSKLELLSSELEQLRGLIFACLIFGGVLIVLLVFITGIYCFCKCKKLNQIINAYGRVKSEVIGLQRCEPYDNWHRRTSTREEIA